jgi:glycosyltransferase involved in cell wall biosynthesis
MKKTTSIALFDQYPFLGGGQIVLLAIAEAAQRVARRTVVYAPTGGALEQMIRQRFGAAVEIMDTPEPRMTHGRKGIADALRLCIFSVAFAFRHCRRMRKVDLMYGNGPRQFPGLLLLSFLTSRLCCYHVHIDHSLIEKRLIAFAARLPSTFKVIVNSDFVYRRLVEAIPELAQNPKILVIENALDASYAARIFVDRFQSPQRTWDVVVLGVLRPQKGQDIAVELARRVPSMHIHLIGRPGPGAEEWVNELKAEAPANVTFHGPVTDVPATVDRLNARINLMPSRWEEPFGLAAIEGMACSCITIVSRRGALVDIAGKTGAIVYGDDTNGLVAAVEQLQSLDLRHLSMMAAQQFNATMNAYHPEQYIGRVSSLFTEALAGI